MFTRLEVTIKVAMVWLWPYVVRDASKYALSVCSEGILSENSVYPTYHGIVEGVSVLSNIYL